MGFPRQEYWSELPFPSPEDLPDPGIEPMSPVYQADSLPLSHLGSPRRVLKTAQFRDLEHIPNPREFMYSGKEGGYTDDPRAGTTWSILSDPQVKKCLGGVLKWAYWKHIAVFGGLQPKDSMSHQLKHTRHWSTEHILMVLKSKWYLQNEVSLKTSCSSCRMRRAEEEKGGAGLSVGNWTIAWKGMSTHSSVQFSHSVMSDSLRPHGLQHIRLPCPSPTPGIHSNSCPLGRWCHPAISSSVVPFSSCLQSFPASGLSKWVSSSHQVAKGLQFQLEHQFFLWIFRTDFL